MRDREPFLSRWSRLKREGERASPGTREPAAVPADGDRTDAPELPPIDSLTPDSDFAAFMHAKVDESVRRAALKKLFSDPRFNVLDGLDDYAEDYTRLENLADGAAAGLEHARRTLLGRDPDVLVPRQGETDTAVAEGVEDVGVPAPHGAGTDADSGLQPELDSTAHETGAVAPQSGAAPDSRQASTRAVDATGSVEPLREDAGRGRARRDG